MHSLWTEQDQKTLEEPVRKRGFADVALGLRHIAHQRAQRKTYLLHDWWSVAGLLTRIYDHVTEKRTPA